MHCVKICRGSKLGAQFPYDEQIVYNFLAVMDESRYARENRLMTLAADCIQSPFCIMNCACTDGYAVCHEFHKCIYEISIYETHGCNLRAPLYLALTLET